MNVAWEHAWVLWLLVPVAGLAAALAFLSARARRRLAAFADDHLLDRLVDSGGERTRAARSALEVFAIAALVVALAGPRWGFHWEEVKRVGIDLIVAVDVSRSMMAADVKPNRLTRAKLAVLDLVGKLEGDRIGLVPFAGTAFLECPLTQDYGAFSRALHSLEPGIIPRGGTSLERAIDVALEGFEGREGRYQAMILITDGEDHEGDAAEAARRAASAGVKVFTVGIGTPDGELIPIEKDGRTSYLKNRSGEVVKTRLDEVALRTVADESGGAYVRGLGPALGLDEVFDGHIAKMERREVSSTMEKRYEARFQIPIGLALFALLMDGIVALVATRKRPEERV